MATWLAARRRGVVLAEMAIVLPAMLLLILGTIVVGLGVFRYHQIAYLAREGARWASTHGPTYCMDQKASTPTAQDVLTQAVVPHMAGLSSADLTPSLTWNTGLTLPMATFTLSYRWVPEAFLPAETFTNTSTSSNAIPTPFLAE
jgi:Flp pilus assembly protein TadG